MRSIDQHVEAGLRELRELDRRAEQAELQRLDSNATRFRVDIIFTDDAATEVQFFRTAHSAVSYAHAMLRSDAPVLVSQSRHRRRHRGGDGRSTEAEQGRAQPTRKL